MFAFPITLHCFDCPGDVYNGGCKARKSAPSPSKQYQQEYNSKNNSNNNKSCFGDIIVGCSWSDRSMLHTACNKQRPRDRRKKNGPILASPYPHLTLTSSAQPKLLPGDVLCENLRCERASGPHLPGCLVSAGNVPNLLLRLFPSSFAAVSVVFFRSIQSCL